MIFRMHKPEWLYEILPQLYAIAGVITILALRNTGGFLSGGLLIAAGGSVWQMRRNYRREILVAHKQELLVEDEKTGLVRIVWRDSFNVGHNVIDMQHRRLFVLGNEIINAILAKCPQEDIELLMHELVEDIETHFQSEEEIMEQHEAPLSESHKSIHSELLRKIKSYEERFHCGDLSVGELVGFIAYDVVAQHIIKEDLKFLPQNVSN